MGQAALCHWQCVPGTRMLGHMHRHRVTFEARRQLDDLELAPGETRVS
jgi:hypothetical protein